MPRDSNNNNDSSRGRRDRPGGKALSKGPAKGRSGAARGPEKKFAKRDFAGKPPGERKPSAGRSASAGDGPKTFGVKTYGAKPYSGPGKPYAGKRVGPPPPPRNFGDRPKRDFSDRPREGGEKRPYTPRPRDDEPRGERPNFKRDDRAPRSDRGDSRPAGRFADKKFGDKKFGEKRPYTPRPHGDRPHGDRPHGDRPRGDRPRGDRPFTARGDRPQSDRPRRDRPFTARSDRPQVDRPFKARGDRPQGDRPYTPRSDRPQGDRPFKPREDRPRSDRPFAEKRFGGDKKFGDRKFGDRPQGRGAPDRGPRRVSSDRPPRRDFADRQDRGERKPYQDKPWQERSDSAPRGDRPARSFDKPRFAKTNTDRPRDAGSSERPRFSRPREDRPREDRPQGEDRFRPREDRNSWQEHPHSETPDRDNRPRRDERQRRDNEDDSKVFAKRPAFGGRGAYRERDPEERRPPRPPAPVKSGERIAKLVARAGLCSRRDAEEWITQGRVSVNGRVITSPALDVTSRDVVTIDGKPLPAPERTRLFLFHKPRGLMTTHADPEGRPTVFDNLPEGLPRLISIGRLDFNTEGLLLLTNDGGLARALELPDTGWLRRYRVRAHGEVTQGQLDQLRDGIEVEGVKYGPIDAQLERDQGANVWLVFAIREGKNREVRNVLAHLGLEVNRLIRVSYGPFQLGEIEEGQVEEVKTRVLREQLGEKIAASAQANFARGPEAKGDASDDPQVRKPMKRGALKDSKGRRVLVQRSGSDEARAHNESEANGYGPPRRPKRGYHGKRDLAPKGE